MCWAYGNFDPKNNLSSLSAMLYMNASGYFIADFQTMKLFIKTAISSKTERKKWKMNERTNETEPGKESWLEGETNEETKREEMRTK